MSFTSLIRTILFNLGALAVAYVLLLSGIHKFTYKLWGIELSQDLYRSLNKSYLLATEQAYKHVDALLAAHPSLHARVPRFPASTVKTAVGVFELLLAFLWMTRHRWRTAARGSALCFACWVAIAWSEFLPDAAGVEDGVTFALFFVALSIGLLYIAPADGTEAVEAGRAGGAMKRR
ncbi:hypothetical protein NSK_007109 [Nannochloropsis salina CCMP1776]|uniref:Uncharacterized protein n=1 Tax=Nannochloropsis salina CCMP1776 TaxID=1027361 RepID=A0A4D9CRM3_9STRA|nr:hypothetical protein NSK_007109 [Nannochloropsis salina CCMP1776]|eukprot:TFJ81862.1 hypothetical protein NSK_007109 [Nannochloropsis salina CCMP1776]